MIEIARALRTPAPGAELGLVGRTPTSARSRADEHRATPSSGLSSSTTPSATCRRGLTLARRIGRPYIAIGCLGPLAHLANLRGGGRTSAEDRSREAMGLPDRLGSSQDPVVGRRVPRVGWRCPLEGPAGASGAVDRPCDAGSVGSAGSRSERLAALHPWDPAVRPGAARRGGHELPRCRARASPRTSCPPRREPGGCVPASASATQRPPATTLVEVGDAAREHRRWCNLSAYVFTLLTDDPISRRVDALRPVLDGSASLVPRQPGDRGAPPGGGRADTARSGGGGRASRSTCPRARRPEGTRLDLSDGPRRGARCSSAIHATAPPWAFLWETWIDWPASPRCGPQRNRRR